MMKESKGRNPKRYKLYLFTILMAVAMAVSCVAIFATDEQDVAADPADNSWIADPSINDTTYGVEPTKGATATYGEVEWNYYTDNECSHPIEGAITVQNVGTYYAKATVTGTAEYTGLASDALQFEIIAATLDIDSVNASYTGTGTVTATERNYREGFGSVIQ